ncbi:MAG: hypothetical protein NTY38_20665, partial [Acidobacteria bacterium]|nr:hypothetical protein [Acidobacteriota bacterium]
MRTYRHSFAEGLTGGWLGWHSNAKGALRLPLAGGAAVASSPWWIDYNHAPPGAGYLHILFSLHTAHGPGFPRQYREAGGENRFVAEGFPRDFRNARITFELKGEMECCGAELLLLAQAKTGARHVNFVLTGQPLAIPPDWSRQTLHLVEDPGEWTCLGSRHDRLETYGEGPISDVLADLNGDIILVLFPLDVRPLESLSNEDRHRLRAGEDYTADERYLPRGQVFLQ